jgi:hypothetical protein
MTAFAKITEAHDTVLRDLTPCAGRLYRWLLRRIPAGRPKDTWLEDFATQFGYSLRHVQRSLKELITTQLVDVVIRYSGRIYKLITWHPNQDKTVPSADENVATGTQMSKTGASNPHSAVPKQQRNLNLTDNSQPHHPVENRQGSEADPLPQRQELTDKQKQKLILAEQAIAPQPLSPQLQATVLKYSSDRIAAAAAALAEQQQKRKVNNPSGLFRRALENAWTPNKPQNANQAAESTSTGAATSPSTPQADWQLAPSPAEMEVFKLWYPLANAVGIACGSEQVNGEIYIHTATGCEPFAHLTAVWSLPRLQEMRQHLDPL